MHSARASALVLGLLHMAVFRACDVCSVVGLLHRTESKFHVKVAVTDS